MRAPRHSKKWPPYIESTQESLHALGVISVVYNRLERALEALLGSTLKIGHEQVSVLFQKIQNDVRISIIQHAMKREEWPALLKDHVAYFLKAYRICAENRHGLMHSNVQMSPSADPRLVFFTKPSRSGDELISDLFSTGQLRQIADELDALARFGIIVASAASLTWRRRAIGEDADGTATMKWHETLLERPPLPSELDWQSLRARRASRSPPQS